jgi:hypothetical protein
MPDAAAVGLFWFSLKKGIASIVNENLILKKI